MLLRIRNQHGIKKSLGPAKLLFLILCACSLTLGFVFWRENSSDAARHAPVTCGVNWGPELEKLTWGLKDKLVIYECMDGVLCGGWGDRLRGWSTLFFSSITLGHNFMMNVTRPSPLEDVLLPRHIWWNIDDIPKDNFPFPPPTAAVPLWDRAKLEKKKVRFVFSVIADKWLAMTIHFLSSIRMAADPVYVPEYGEALKIEADNYTADLPTDHYQRRVNRDVFRNMNSNYYIGCAFHFLFGPSRTLMDFVEEGVRELVHLLHPKLIPPGPEFILFPWQQFATFPDYRERYTIADHLDGTPFAIPRVIGIHIRIAGMQPAAKVTWFEPDIVRTPLEAVPKLVHCAEKFADRMGWKDAIVLVASDSRVVRKAVVEIPVRAGLRVMSLSHVENNLHHIDRDKSDPGGVESSRSFSEMILLSMSDALILTRSGFGLISASIGFLPAERLMHFYAPWTNDECDFEQGLLPPVLGQRNCKIEDGEVKCTFGDF